LVSRAQSAVPKYLQVAHSLRDEIVRGKRRPGDELPSERELAEQWDISRPTATRALAVLRNEGLAEARQGSGTFVRSKPRLNRRAPDRYAKSRRLGHVYEPGARATILAAELVPVAPEEVVAELGIGASDPAIRRRRLISDSSGPVELSTSWFDGRLGDRAPRLLEMANIAEGTVAHVERALKRRAVTARDMIGARLATSEEKRRLDLAGSRPAVLVVRHSVRDLDGGVLEFVEAVYSPERWAFEQEYAIPT